MKKNTLFGVTFSSKLGLEQLQRNISNNNSQASIALTLNIKTLAFFKRS